MSSKGSFWDKMKGVGESAKEAVPRRFGGMIPPGVAVETPKRPPIMVKDSKSGVSYPLDSAVGGAIDRIADIHGVRRKLGETDSSFRERIRAHLMARHSITPETETVTTVESKADKAPITEEKKVENPWFLDELQKL